MKIWSCKIGEVNEALLPPGADCPMRDAIAEAYEKLTGQSPQFIFSGWGSELTEGERAVVENRMPHDSAMRWYERYGVSEENWDAMLKVVVAAKAIGDHLAEFGNLEGIPKVFDSLYSSLDKCKDAFENGESE